MKVLVGCEFSGVVRAAFEKRGHDAWSCDLIRSESKTEKHLRCDVLKVIDGGGWQLGIFHPPCTHLAVSGAKHFKWKRNYLARGELFPRNLVEEAILFFMKLALAPIDKSATENPISVMSTLWRKPDQIIQPWQFGHGETKSTCLWLKNLPKLQPTNIVEGRDAKVHREPPGKNRWKNRSRTYQGIADAMAEQWGGPVND